MSKLIAVKRFGIEDAPLIVESRGYSTAEDVFDSFFTLAGKILGKTISEPSINRQHAISPWMVVAGSYQQNHAYKEAESTVLMPGKSLKVVKGIGSFAGSTVRISSADGLLLTSKKSRADRSIFAVDGVTTKEYDLVNPNLVLAKTHNGFRRVVSLESMALTYENIVNGLATSPDKKTASLVEDVILK